MARDRPEAFHDVVTGSNKGTTGYICKYGWPAASGWDAASGVRTHPTSTLCWVRIDNSLTVVCVCSLFCTNKLQLGTPNFGIMADYLLNFVTTSDDW